MAKVCVEGAIKISVAPTARMMDNDTHGIVDGSVPAIRPRSDADANLPIRASPGPSERSSFQLQARAHTDHHHPQRNHDLLMPPTASPPLHPGLPPMIGFIGWHNSGKTTLVSRVVALLHNRGFMVAVIKSTKERGLDPEPEQSDTAIHRSSGADPVLLLAPDQLIVHAGPGERDLPTLVDRYCRHADLVIVEGCKQATGLAKIEVRRDAAAPLLRDQVEGVIAVATDQPLAGGPVFGLNDAEAIADLIEHRFLRDPRPVPARVSLLVNGRETPLAEPQRRQLWQCVQAATGAPASLPGEATLTLHIEWQPSANQI